MSAPRSLSFYPSVSSSPPLTRTPTLAASNTKLWSDMRPYLPLLCVIWLSIPLLSPHPPPPSASSLSFTRFRPPGVGYHVIKSIVSFDTQALNLVPSSLPLKKKKEKDREVGDGDSGERVRKNDMKWDKRRRGRIKW